MCNNNNNNSSNDDNSNNVNKCCGVKLGCTQKTEGSVTTAGSSTFASKETSWQGAVQMLSTIPRLFWVLLGSGKSTDGHYFWQPLHAARLQTHLASGRNSV